jgi:hypothetical protein
MIHAAAKNKYGFDMRLSARAMASMKTEPPGSYEAIFAQFVL